MVNITLKQNRKAKGVDKYGETYCQYLAENGDKCAVGCLISKTNYREDMEGNLIEAIIEKGWMPAHLIKHGNLLDQLQNVHDCMNVNSWYDEFQKVADEYNLKMPNLNP